VEGNYSFNIIKLSCALSSKWGDPAKR